MSSFNHQQVRNEAFERSKFNPMQSKFGMFSYPGFIATGEDIYARPLPNHRDNTGKVRLGPKNFMVSASSTSSNGGCFSMPKYECDLYKDPPRLYQIERDRVSKIKEKNGNGSTWKYNGKFKEASFPYEYMGDPLRSTPCHKEPDGNVKTGLKGFFTSPPKRGSSTPGVTIGKDLEYSLDPYENYETWLKNEKLRQKEKRLYGDFKTTDFGQKCFTGNKELYKPAPVGNGFKKYEYESANHPKPFMSTCPIGFTIGKKPPHLTDTVVDPPQSKKIEKPWKHTGVLGSVPSRSVAKMMKEYPF